MKRLLLSSLMMLALVLIPSWTVAGVGTVLAADCGTANSSKDKIEDGIGNTSHNCSDQGVAQVISAIVTILTYIVGVVVVIAVISAGFKYITSGGDPGKTKNAKETLIYAMIGLVIVVLAQVIVRITVDVTDKAANQCQYDKTLTPEDPKCVAPKKKTP